LLNLAECEIEVGSLAQATTYLNMIRSRPVLQCRRCLLQNTLWTQKLTRLLSLQHEKMVEFAGEQLRNKDILRWRKNGKFAAYGISEPISYFQANKYELLPIPQVEFSTNAKLASSDQNPGY
jgi:hypothetical protein